MKYITTSSIAILCIKNCIIMRNIDIKLYLIFFVLFTGCEGPEGAQGPAGPEGPGFPMFNYLGDNASKCGH